MNELPKLPELMAKKFDRRDQMIKLLEELGECSAAVSRVLMMIKEDHYMADGNLKKFNELSANMIDEIIDVEFLFDQMRHYFDGFEDAKKKNDEEIERRFFSKGGE